jgi:hypothetical protein
MPTEGAGAGRVRCCHWAPKTAPASLRFDRAIRPCLDNWANDPIVHDASDLARVWCCCGHTVACHLAARPARRVDEARDDG